MACESIDKAGLRNRLQPRREPYWGPPVERGLYVGFRRLDMGGNWVARYRSDDGGQVYKALGPVTEENDYDAAKTEARRWRKASKRKPIHSRRRVAHGSRMTGASW